MAFNTCSSEIRRKALLTTGAAFDTVSGCPSSARKNSASTAA